MNNARRAFLTGRAPPQPVSTSRAEAVYDRRELLQLFAIVVFVLLGFLPHGIRQMFKEMRRGETREERWGRLMKEHYLPLWERHFHSGPDMSKIIVRGKSYIATSPHRLYGPTTYMRLRWTAST